MMVLFLKITLFYLGAIALGMAGIFAWIHTGIFIYKITPEILQKIVGPILLLSPFLAILIVGTYFEEKEKLQPKESNNERTSF